jgi:hypothetical protein
VKLALFLICSASLFATGPRPARDVRGGEWYRRSLSIMACWRPWTAPRMQCAESSRPCAYATGEARTGSLFSASRKFRDMNDMIARRCCTGRAQAACRWSRVGWNLDAGWWGFSLAWSASGSAGHEGSETQLCRGRPLKINPSTRARDVREQPAHFPAAPHRESLSAPEGCSAGILGPSQSRLCGSPALVLHLSVSLPHSY